MGNFAPLCQAVAQIAAVLASFACLAVGALGVVVYINSTRIKHRLDELTRARDIYALASQSSVYVPKPPVTTGAVESPADFDLAGAWALEMQLAGQRVTPDEVEMQRLMRQEAGL